MEEDELPYDCNACRMSAARACDAVWMPLGTELPEAAVEVDAVVEDVPAVPTALVSLDWASPPW